jgi:3alpha(or 20beta)-hydroxysteroid dehydrogenase
MPRLVGKTAFVTGGARGMGESHVRAIVAEGGRAIIADVLDDAGRALERDLGPDVARFVHLDVTDTESWAAAVAFAREAFGGFNVLVNNAGILRSGPIGELSDTDWDLVLAVNLSGAFKGIRASVETLAESAPSSIINISSTAGLKAFPADPAYTSTKWALRGLTKSVAIELASRGIRANSIHPGNVLTPMIDGLYVNYAHVPQGRAGLPAEISALLVFLASDESSFSTGSEFVADGGETAGLPAALLAPDA